MTFIPLPVLEIKASDIAYNLYKYASLSVISKAIYDKPVPKEKVQELFKFYVDCLKTEIRRGEEEDNKEAIRQKQVSNFIVSV